jgi:hypothetical protein
MHSARIIAPSPARPKGSRTWQILQILRRNPQGLTTLEVMNALKSYYGAITCSAHTDLCALREQLRAQPEHGCELPEARLRLRPGGARVYVYRLRPRGQMSLIDA